MYKHVDTKKVPRRLGASFDGQAGDPGHWVKDVVQGNNLCMIWVVQEAGVASPMEDFVFHPEHEEIEYVVYGGGKAMYPDGRVLDLKPGLIVYHPPMQPHKFVNDTDEPLILLVIYPAATAAAVKRIRFVDPNKA